MVKGQAREVNVHKRALPSPLYLELGSAQQHMSNFLSHTIALGHNRHATKGNSSDPEGAHPFQHDHITLVHNGSLTTHRELTAEHFTVDSEAICKAIAVDGIEVVGPKLRGAFALVWIDSKENTLNFLRNGEREFAIAWNTPGNRMWWASEQRMLEWSLNRDTFTRNPVVYDTCFELPEGKLISIPITHTGINIAGRTESEIDISNSVYVAPVYNYGYRQDPKSPSANTSLLERQAVGAPLVGETVTKEAFGLTRENALKKLSAELLTERGKTHYMTRSFISSLDMNADAALLDERIGVFLTGWDSYTTAHVNGALVGKMMEYPYTEVTIHGFTEKEYDELYFKTNGCISAYIKGFVVPSVSLVTVQAGQLMDLEDLQLFTVILRKDSIRTANVSNFEWSMEHVPDEDSDFMLRNDAEIKAEAEEMDDTPALTLVHNEESPGPTDPLLIFELPDGTRVSPGGTAVFTGASSALKADLRYKITKICKSTHADKVLITINLNGTPFIYESSKWEQGTLSKEADQEVELPTILGPDGELLTMGKWQAVVAKGCYRCNEVPSDPKVAESLEWTNDEFLCGPCLFETANVGYN